MFDPFNLQHLPGSARGFDGTVGASRERRYRGPERRAASADQRRLALMADEIDYGLLLLRDERHVAHLNRAARRELDASHPLQLLGDELHARHAPDAALLRDALSGACQRGLRRLLRLGSEADGRITLSVVPLPRQPGETHHCAVLVLGKRQVCEELTIDWFARAHGLTMAETQVVKGLCADLTPQQIAQRQGVGLATVRTQIGSVRAKTAAPSIRALVRQVALLPPLMGMLAPARPLDGRGTPPAAPARADSPPGASATAPARPQAAEALRV